MEWQLYIESLAADISAEDVVALDARFHFSDARNYDILEKWLPRTIRAGYQPGLRRTEDVLGAVGRMKYLRPLYLALTERPRPLDSRASASSGLRHATTRLRAR